MAKTPEPIAYSLSYCAAILQCGKPLIKSLLEAGHLKAFRIGKRSELRVTKDSWDKYIAELTKEI